MTPGIGEKVGQAIGIGCLLMASVITLLCFAVVVHDLVHQL